MAGIENGNDDGASSGAASGGGGNVGSAGEQGTGDASAAGNDGSAATGSGSDGDNGDASGGNHGFDGEFDAQRARQLIDRLREEARATREELRRVQGADNGSGEGKPNDSKPADNETESQAIARIERLENQLRNTTARNQFLEVAQSQAFSIRPEAAQMAFNEVRGRLEQSDDGTVTNLTDVLASLKTTSPFLFAEKTGGVQPRGSTGGGGANGMPNGQVPTTEVTVAARAFNMTPERYLELKEAQRTGQRPPKR